MANNVLHVVGTQLVFADHAGDFVGGAAKTSLEVAGTDVQIALTGLVKSGTGRESAKFDFGATRASRYSLGASLEFAGAPVVGELVNFYLAPSPISTAANGNPQSIDGVDAAAPSGHSTLQELIDASMWIGRFICSADATATVQTAWCGSFVPPERYGILIVVNNTAQDFHSDDVEIHVVMNPIITQVQ